MIETLCRWPACQIASTVAITDLKQVVSKTLIPTTCGLCSAMAWTNFAAGTSTPRSTTSKPTPRSIMITMSLPMS